VDRRLTLLCISRKPIRAAQTFLQKAPEWSHLPVHFDVIALCGIPHQDPEITWVESAFTL